MTISFFIQDHLFFPQKNSLDEEKFLVNASQSSYLVEIVSTIILPENSFVVIDEQVFASYKHKINFSHHKIFYCVATEENKIFDAVLKLVHFFSKNNVTKSDVIAVIGGGITQEIASFACAIYKRGIAYHHFPTTLVAMCDSCIGGKTSLNFEGTKNQLGLFYPPSRVSIFPDFIDTLTRGEIQSGLGEVLKSCMIGGDFFLAVYQEWAVSKNIKFSCGLKKLIFSALLIKKEIVEFDEYEKKYRAALNLGHTLGHAIEALFTYKIPHGQAVVVGLILENHISHQLNILSKENRDFLNELCFSLIDEKIKKAVRGIVAAELVPLIQKDKKTLGNSANFVLLKKPGELVFVSLALDAILVSYIEIALAEF